MHIRVLRCIALRYAALLTCRRTTPYLASVEKTEKQVIAFATCCAACLELHCVPSRSSSSPLCHACHVTLRAACAAVISAPLRLFVALRYELRCVPRYIPRCVLRYPAPHSVMLGCVKRSATQRHPSDGAPNPHEPPRPLDNPLCV